VKPLDFLRFILEPLRMLVSFGMGLVRLDPCRNLSRRSSGVN
jgi:hypothetical protein